MQRRSQRLLLPAWNEDELQFQKLLRVCADGGNFNDAIPHDFYNAEGTRRADVRERMYGPLGE